MRSLIRHGKNGSPEPRHPRLGFDPSNSLSGKDQPSGGV
jgi:hypothetical protein